jgi:hypothetical protein
MTYTDEVMAAFLTSGRSKYAPAQGDSFLFRKDSILDLKRLRLTLNRSQQWGPVNKVMNLRGP